MKGYYLSAPKKCFRVKSGILKPFGWCQQLLFKCSIGWEPVVAQTAGMLIFLKDEEFSRRLLYEVIRELDPSMDGYTPVNMEGWDASWKKTWEQKKEIKETVQAVEYHHSLGKCLDLDLDRLPCMGKPKLYYYREDPVAGRVTEIPSDTLSYSSLKGCETLFMDGSDINGVKCDDCICKPGTWEVVNMSGPWYAEAVLDSIRIMIDSHPYKPSRFFVVNEGKNE